MRVRRAPAAISDPAKVKGPNPVVRQLMDGPRGPRLCEQEACRPRTAAILLWLKGGPQRPGNGDRKSKAVPKGTFSRGAAGRMIGRRTRDSIRSLPAAGGHGAGTIPASTYSTQVPRQWTGSIRVMPIVLTTLSCALAHPAPAPVPPPSRRPNIIFIVTDDMTVEDLEHLPRVKSLLVDPGLTFVRAFVTDSV